MSIFHPHDENARLNTKHENEALSKSLAPHIKSTKALEKVGSAVQGAVHTVVDKAESLVGMSKGEAKKPDIPNRGCVFGGANTIRVDSIPYPKMELPWNGEKVNNGAIVKILTSAICGSDLHAYRGRTTMQPGTIIGHEFTGEIVEIGTGVQHMKVGDWGAVPFNVACGTCSSCKGMRPEVCERNNHQRESYYQGGIYGYVCGGDWQGGQAEHAFVPFVDYNFIRFEDKTLAKSKLLDLTMLTDVLPTAMHGTEEAMVGFGQTVYIAGAGPIGLATAAISLLKGACHVIVSDFNVDRLELARRLGCLTIDLNNISDEKKLGNTIKDLIGCQWVDCSIECVGYEARGFGTRSNVCAAALQGCIEVTKPAGRIGVLGAFLIGDPKGPSASEKSGFYNLPFGEAWMNGLVLQGGQAICVRYETHLYKMVLSNKLPIATLLNAKVVSLDQAPQAYAEFNAGASHKYIIDPHNTLGLLGTSTSK
jgi:glutathione-independent formaldehyde dehydrogenase